jgi:hypothetical protein
MNHETTQALVTIMLHPKESGGISAPTSNTSVSTPVAAPVEVNQTQSPTTNLDTLFNTPPATPEDMASPPTSTGAEAGFINTPLSDKASDDLLAYWAAKSAPTTLKGKTKSIAAKTGMFDLSKPKKQPVIRKVTAVTQIPVSATKPKPEQAALTATKRKAPEVDEDD